jgi:hypothetical protein
MPRKTPETAGERLKREVLAAYELSPAERLLLDRAAVLADVCARLDEQVAASPLTVPGSMGQEVANPLLLQQRKHHERLQRLLEAVRLPAKDEISGASATSRAAQRAAQARWAKQKGSVA